MTSYDSLNATAKRLIADKGRSVTFNRANASYDPITDTHTEAGTSFSAKAVFTEFKQAEIDGTIILRGDKKVLLASDAEPAHNDVIVDGSEQYRVIEIMSVQPGDTLLLYKVQVRK